MRIYDNGKKIMIDGFMHRMNTVREKSPYIDAYIALSKHDMEVIDDCVELLVRKVGLTESGALELLSKLGAYLVNNANNKAE